VVPATRTLAVVSTLVALLTFAITIVLARDRLVVLVTSVPLAVLYSGAMILMLPRLADNAPPPVWLSPDQLPRPVPGWKAVAPGATLLVGVGAGAAAFSLSVHEYVAVGIVLGVPIMAWDSVRRAQRTERNARGTLWSSTGFAWTSKDRIRYLVASA
jgi:hypothetical protein